ncbi:glycerol-3-phosphate dehydrogenase [Terriglobus roseus DSM 18391]|uniref:Glycerol-3-phosphate dehydrogenase [NAD(P)+] n=1 Tax=Terriglobus roseus (strain DSM 18391 / NRRL B-41598 / KBS 63) TaxID=926566 RepID=I3ZDF0_TERRK|nr:NAD(P)H-dependent glycerol-3-phosphate dehydrogenase [Terriglobus roseus]AFL87268.1 glycerol-3-phosphate dehydrogenase [Terriglobus roseus DSM 18391]
MSRIAVLGAGAWGTALALSLARQQRHTVTLWAHTPAHAEAMEQTRENAKFLPGFQLPSDLAISSSLDAAVDQADVLLAVTPSDYMDQTIHAIAPALRENHLFVSASKGIQDRTFRRMSEVVAAASPIRFATLGGPSFAREVAAGLPTAVTLATRDQDVARALQSDFSSESLRVYTNDDVVGVELGGALKNVIALAAGVVDGLQLGSNASAALITRGMAEITRLSVACGARPETMAGLAGYGDLVLTCTGSLSRNRTVGVELGRGRTLPDILASLNGKVAEGVRCTGAALGLARQHGIEMPITSEMYAILHEGRSPVDAIRALMTRPGRDESVG